MIINRNNEGEFSPEGFLKTTVTKIITITKYKQTLQTNITQ